MTNIYVPSSVPVRSVHSEPGLPGGDAVLVADLDKIVGFALRVWAVEHFQVLTSEGEVSATERAMAAVRAEEYLAQADVVDPDRQDESESIRSNYLKVYR